MQMSQLNQALSDETAKTANAAAGMDGDDPVCVLRDLGLAAAESQMLTIGLSAINDQHLPCAALLKGGRALAITRILPGGLYEVRQGEDTHSMSREDLAAVYGGSIIASRKRGEGPLSVAPEPQGPGAEIHTVASSISPTSAAPERMQIAGAAPRIGDGKTAPHEPDHITFGTLFWHTLKFPKMFEIILVAIMSNLFMFALPLFSMAVYDRIIPHKAYETLWALATGITILLAVDFVGRILKGKIQENISYQLSASLQVRLFGRVLQTDIENAPKTPSTVTSAFQTVEALCQLMPGLVVGLLIDLPFVIGLFIYVGITARWVVVVPLLSAGIIVVSNMVLHYRARRAHAETMKQSIARNVLMEESVTSFGVAKVTGSAEPLYRSLTGLLVEAHHTGQEAKNSANYAMTISNTVIQFNTVLALVAGVLVINQGGMTVGALVSAVMLSQRGISPLISLAGLVTRAASLVEPLHLVNSLIRMPQEEQGDASRTVSRIRGQIEYSGVTFRYASAVTPALKDITLSIRPGEKIGIIGSIGSGKSSFLKLLLRLYNPELGGVLVDGHDVRQYDPEFLRRQIAYMPQDCDLFETSIRENIIRGMPFVDEDQFEMATRVSGVRDIVTRNPAGYDLQVGKFGRRLSGGERQAVCLARALVRPAPVLLMDEPTSSMDSQMERTIIDRLGEVLGNRTLIVATHRAPLLSLVDRVIWLEQGKIIADGTPAEVIARASKAA